MRHGIHVSLLSLQGLSQRLDIGQTVLRQATLLFQRLLDARHLRPVLRHQLLPRTAQPQEMARPADRFRSGLAWL